LIIAIAIFTIYSTCNEVRRLYALMLSRIYMIYFHTNVGPIFKVIIKVLPLNSAERLIDNYV